MTVVTIKKINRKTTFTRDQVSGAVKAAIAVHGRPKSVVVRVKKSSPKKK